MSPEETELVSFIKALPLRSKRRLSRLECAWCGQRMDKSWCGAIYEKCSVDTRKTKINAAIAENRR